MRTIGWLVVLAACGDDGGAAPDAASDAAPTQTVTETKRVLVGEIAEATMTGGEGDRVVIELDAPDVFDWNIHGHAGGSTQTVKEEFEVTTARYTFAPTAEAEWYLLVRNQHTAPMDVQVRIELYGDVVWSGWQ